MKAVSVRAKATIAVFVLSTSVLGVAATLALNALDNQLRSDAEESVVALLDTYLANLDGRDPFEADTQGPTRYFQREADDELSSDEWIDLIRDSMLGTFEQKAFTCSETGDRECIPIELSNTDRANLPPTPEEQIVSVDAASLIDSIDSEIRVADTDDETITAIVDLTIGDRQLTVGVSQPSRLVDDPVAAVTNATKVLVPLLIGAMTVATWLIVGAALRPVHAITSAVQSINSSNLHERIQASGSGDEIDHLGQTMNEMLQRLDTAEQRTNRFIGDASHELRSPVTASIAQLEVAVARSSTAEWEVVASTVLDEQRRLSSLVDNLLLLARFDAREAIAAVDIDLEDLVTDEANRPRQLPVQITRAEPCRVAGDEAGLTHAIRNLLDNAARHGTGAVHVEVRHDVGDAVVSIDDDGPGVPEAERERIFERFSRLDSARSRTDGGGGLGLAIAHDVVGRHQGSISCSTSALGGASFTIRLPLADVEPAMR